MECQIRFFFKTLHQPIALLLQEIRPLAAHHFRRSTAGGSRTLRPLHDAGHAHIKRHGPCRLTISNHRNYPLTQIERICSLNACWPPLPVPSMNHCSRPMGIPRDSINVGKTLGGGSADRSAPQTTEPAMTTIETRASSQAKRVTRAISSKTEKPKASKKKSAKLPTAIVSAATKGPGRARATKRDQILKLLSRREGASIPEIMEACGWQQHSVRGFLSGTVKKKLGLELTSSKTDGEARCDRVAQILAGRGVRARFRPIATSLSQAPEFAPVGVPGPDQELWLLQNQLILPH